MTFNEGVQLDPGRVRTSRGRKGAVIGGGGVLGVLALYLLSQLTGVDLTGLAGGGGGDGVTAQDGADLDHCTDATAANQDVNCRVVGALESLDAYWAEALPAAGLELTIPQAELFEDSVATGCGNATSAVGPFYCPPDQAIYLDTSFYAELRDRFGSSGGPLAEMYVVAHEYGHHIEQLTGLMDQAERGGTGPESDSVRIELTADCFAGMWARAASTVPDPDTGVPFLEPLSPTQIADALSAASAVGDDRIQEQATGTVNPESWTHGSSEQRQRWFLVGFDGGTIEDCNALAAASL
jgi:predicted metalloprotease